VLRTALSAIANAEAQPDPEETPVSLRSEGSIAGAAAGVGASEAARRTLDEQDARHILEAERNECLAAAEDLTARGAQSQADALYADAAILEQYLDG
jgi:hypothetical protein